MNKKSCPIFYSNRPPLKVRTLTLMLVYAYSAPNTMFPHKNHLFPTQTWQTSLSSTPDIPKKKPTTNKTLLSFKMKAKKLLMQIGQVSIHI